MVTAFVPWLPAAPYPHVPLSRLTCPAGYVTRFAVVRIAEVYSSRVPAVSAQYRRVLGFRVGIILGNTAAAKTEGTDGVMCAAQERKLSDGICLVYQGEQFPCVLRITSRYRFTSCLVS